MGDAIQQGWFPLHHGGKKVKVLCSCTCQKRAGKVKPAGSINSTWTLKVYGFNPFLTLGTTVTMRMKAKCVKID